MIIIIIITNNRIVNTTEPRILPIEITKNSIVVELTVLKEMELWKWTTIIPEGSFINWSVLLAITVQFPGPLILYARIPII